MYSATVNTRKSLDFDKSAQKPLFTEPSIYKKAEQEL